MIILLTDDGKRLRPQQITPIQHNGQVFGEVNDISISGTVVILLQRGMIGLS